MTYYDDSDDLRNAVEDVSNDALTIEDREAIREKLVAGIQSIQVQFTEHRARLEQYRQECLAAGPDAKSDFFAAETAHREWKGRANGFSRFLQQAHRRNDAELKRLRIERAKNEDAMKSASVQGVLREIAKIDCPHCQCAQLVRNHWAQTNSVP